MIACLASSPSLSASSATRAATASVNIFLSNEVASRMRRTYALNRTEWFPLQTNGTLLANTCGGLFDQLLPEADAGTSLHVAVGDVVRTRSRISPYSHLFAFLISQQAAAHNPLLVDVEVGCQTKLRVSVVFGPAFLPAPRMHAAVSAQGPSSPRKMTGCERASCLQWTM